MSRIYESDALLPPDATPDMNIPYLNMAITGETQLQPHALLDEIKRLEKELGRVQRCYWGPREIDIDILAMDDLVMKSSELTIPHKQILLRDFVMLPLRDIAPDWVYPAAGPYRGMAVKDIVTLLGYQAGDAIRESGLSLHA